MVRSAAVMPVRAPQRRRVRICTKARDAASQKQMERWVRGRYGRVGPLRSPPTLAGEMLAEIQEFVVCLPLASDALRLRELEREFVFDHSRLYAREAWHDEVTASAWCDLVNVIEDEKKRRDCDCENRCW